MTVNKYILLSFFLCFTSLYAGGKCKIIYFHENDCPDCKKINDSVLPIIIEKYGNKIEFIKRDVDKMKNFEAMMAFESKYGISPQEVPEFYTPFGVTWKPDKIQDELPALIDKQLNYDTPGKYADFLNKYIKTGETGISAAESIQQQYLGKKKLIIYEFQKSGCRSCDRLGLSIGYLKKKYPDQLEIKTYNINDIDASIINEALSMKYQVPAELHLTTPALFFGETAINGKDAFTNKDIVKLVISTYNQINKKPTLIPTDEDLNAAKEAIYARYTAISWTAVLIAGLLDGVNPCAFVTIIFLLSYLALMKYSKKQIAIVGLSFTLAVFQTYLLIGLGFLKFLSFIHEMPFVNEIVYYFAIGLAAVIGLLNVMDYYKIKKGSLKDMTFKLNQGLRKKINEVIRKNVKLHHYIIGAFGMGVAISLLELTCTGQVYLPTVLFIINTQGIELRAVILLLVYNIAFIIPLIVIFILFWHGSTEKRITEWLEKHGAQVKLAMGLLFLGLAVFLYLFR